MPTEKAHPWYCSPQLWGISNWWGLLLGQARKWVTVTCHHSSFYDPFLSQFHNNSHLLSLPFLLLFFLWHIYGRRQDNKTCIWTQQTTGTSTLVRLWSWVGVPSHLLPVLFLDMLSVDHLCAMIQLPHKVIWGNPAHIGVPLQPNQWFHHHLNQCWRTLDQLISAAQWPCGCNKHRTRIWVKTLHLIIPCHRSSFYDPSFHNSIMVLTHSPYPFSPYSSYNTHIWERMKQQDMYLDLTDYKELYTVRASPP